MENKTIQEYMKNHQLKIGGFLFSYSLGILTKYEFIKIVESQYNDEKYALLKPIAQLSYEGKKWREVFGYETENLLLRANINFDVRFNVDAKNSLLAGIQSLQAHINSSQWQLDKAKEIIKNSFG